MKISQHWLTQYIQFKISPEDLAERLSMLGLEFESIEHPGEKYRGFVVGKVLVCDRHPNADTLSVCKVDTGKQKIQVVCGAPNVAAGQKVAVGLVGATVPKNQHDSAGRPFVLSEIQIRGVASQGMICSEYELDLGNDADGILVLSNTARVGQTLSSLLGLDDILYSVEITPNRPDWLSHFGIAREIGVVTGKHPRLPVVKVKEGRTPVKKHLSVIVEDKTHCERFAVRLIRGVTIGPSPAWLQNALRAVGLRPRNNVVDVTNFVMLECGQPLHAFDYSLLKGHRIVVRETRRGTSFKTLDGKERILPPGTVMVCDDEREVSIAGIMGGANSEITEATTDIVLEAACWNPSSIRRTAKALGISTDASQRFERGADISSIPYALNRAAQLIAGMAGGEPLKGMIDVYPKHAKPQPVQLRVDRVNAVLGTSLSRQRIRGILQSLDISIAGKKSGVLVCTIPMYRVDIKREIDLIEEVARVYGYNKIETRTRATIDFSSPIAVSGSSKVLRDALTGFGFHEAVTNSLLEANKASLSSATAVSVLNPNSIDMASLRTSLVPGLLAVAARNQSFGNNDLRLFEIGHVFWVDSSNVARQVENFGEEERVCLLMTGLSAPRHWSEAPKPVDFYDIKGQVMGLLAKFALDKTTFISYSTHETLAENQVVVEVDGVYAGYFGAVRGDVLKTFGVEQPVFVAEFGIPALKEQRVVQYEPLPRYPKVKRDVAFILDTATTVGDLTECMRSSSDGLLTSVEVFDVYSGDKVPPGKKSLAFSLELMSRERTLSEEDIVKEMKEIVAAVEQRFGASLRSIKG